MNMLFWSRGGWRVRGYSRTHYTPGELTEWDTPRTLCGKVPHFLKATWNPKGWHPKVCKTCAKIAEKERNAKN